MHLNLEPCFAGGQIDIDNNPVVVAMAENAARTTKLGAKSRPPPRLRQPRWLFVEGADTGRRSSVVYTMAEQVRRLCLDPFAYLEWVFGKLPGMTNQADFEPLLPRNWAAAQREPAAEAA